MAKGRKTGGRNHTERSVIYCFKCNQEWPATADYFNKNGYSPYYCSPCKKCRASAAQLCRLKERREILSHYSEGLLVCACCGETCYEFLTLDHINGGGNKQRKEIGPIYAWVRKNNFPDGFQVLCYNCNCAKGMYGQCPHKAQEEGAAWL